MKEIKSYTDLIVWQKAHQIGLMVIDLIEAFPKMKSLDVIAPQLLRASNSISANIAEGYGSYGNKEYGRYLKISFKSALETDNWLRKLIDSKRIRDTINIDLVLRIQALTFEVIKMLISLIKKIKQIPIACLMPSA